MIERTIGRYQIKGKLGKGSMALVLHAYDPRFERDVALKVLHRKYADDPATQQRFVQEARAIASLEHPAIVPIYDAGQADGFSFLVMRLMSGRSLLHRIQEGALPAEEIIPILNRVASALDEIHRRGIVHRDIKPDNILFDQYGQAYLSDFGIVKATIAQQRAITDSLVGTPAYISPEQVNGGDVDGRSDIYALGSVLFEMLTGELPYQAETVMKMVMRHATEPVPKLRERNPALPGSWQAVIDKAMAKKPEDRFQTAGELAAAFRAAASAKRQAGFIRRVSAGPGFWSIATATFLMLGFLGWGTWGLLQARQPDRATPTITESPVSIVSGSTTIETATIDVNQTASANGTAIALAVGATATQESLALMEEATAQIEAMFQAQSATMAAQAGMVETSVAATVAASLPTNTPTRRPTPRPTATATPAPAPTSANLPGTSQSGPGLPLGFEAFGVWRIGDQPYGSFMQTQEQVRVGTAAAKLSYDFPTTGNDFVVFLQTNAIAGAPNALSMWVYGDASYHFLNVWILDSGGQTWQVPFGQVAHRGWQKITGYIDTAQPWPWTSISGPDNGQVDYPISLRAIVLDDYSESYQGSGTIYLDDLAATTVTNLPGATPGIVVVTRTATPAGNALPIPTPSPTLSATDIGRILYTSGNTLMTTDPSANTGREVGTYVSDTCRSPATTLAGDSFELYYGYFCGIGETITICPSPNGQYEVLHDGRNQTNTMVVRPVGNPDASLAIYQGEMDRAEGIRWSPDSSSFLFVVRDAVHQGFPASPAYREIISIAYGPSFSVDGSLILYLKPVGPGVNDVFVSNADGSNARNLTNISTVDKRCPAWRR